MVARGHGQFVQIREEGPQPVFDRNTDGIFRIHGRLLGGVFDVRMGSISFK
jgi:hypothetical protein